MSEPMSEDDVSTILSRWASTAEVSLSIARAGNDRPIVYVNRAFEEVSGYSAEEVLGREDRFMQAGPHDERVGSYAAPEVLDEQEGPSTTRVLNHRADGSTWWADVHQFPVGDDSGRATHVVDLQFDVTRQVEHEQDRYHSSTHDEQTGLVRRAHFLTQLDREIARARRDHGSLAVLFLDVDHLKTVNDTHGHATGDAVLREVATRLLARLRRADLAGRYGGDEFVVLLVGLPAAEPEAAAAAAQVVDELVRVLREPVPLGDSWLPLSVSIGTALYPHSATTAVELLAQADAAMYRQKRGA